MIKRTQKVMPRKPKPVRPRQIYYIAPKGVMSGEPYVGVGREQRRAPGDNSLRSRRRTEGTAVGPYAFGYTVRHSIVSNATLSGRAEISGLGEMIVSVPRVVQRCSRLVGRDILNLPLRSVVLGTP